jgi:hypothetical protein
MNRNIAYYVYSVLAGCIQDFSDTAKRAREKSPHPDRAGDCTDFLLDQLALTASRGWGLFVGGSV